MGVENTRPLSPAEYEQLLRYAETLFLPQAVDWQERGIDDFWVNRTVDNQSVIIGGFGDGYTWSWSTWDDTNEDPYDANVYLADGDDWVPVAIWRDVVNTSLELEEAGGTPFIAGGVECNPNFRHGAHFGD